jgi:hypothetical protein
MSMIARNVFDIPERRRRQRQKSMTRRVCAGLLASHAQLSAAMRRFANDSGRVYRYCFMKIVRREDAASFLSQRTRRFMQDASRKTLHE